MKDSTIANLSPDEVDAFLRARSHETQRYYELPGTARYEYRTAAGDGMSGWQDAGNVCQSVLDEIKEGLKDTPYWEARVVVSVADYTGTYAGMLIRTERIQGGTEA